MRSARLVGARGVRALICLGLVLLSPGAPQFAASQGAPEPLDQARANLARYADLLEELRSHIDRTQFDVDALAFELAFEEPDVIVDWVRDAIRFEPYDGLLRGAEGALMARAGNALDQAVLLATLLRDAGYDAHVVSSTLDRTHAGTLVDALRTPVPERPPLGDLDAMNDVMQRLVAFADTSPSEADALADVVQGDTEVLDARLYADVDQMADRIEATLSEHGISIGTASPDVDLVDVATSYHWVRHRSGLDDAWTEAHPAFPTSDTVPHGLEIDEVYEESIPERLQHRVRFEAFIERRLGDDLVTAPLTATWERPAANMVGVPLTYMNLPDGVRDTEDLANVDQALERTNFFIPTFGRALAEGGQFFDLAGNLVPPEAAASPYAGVFQSVGQLGADAVDALGALGASEPDRDEPSVALTKQWLEFMLIGPGGNETRHERILFDRAAVTAGPAGDDDLALKRELFVQTTFMVSTGSLPPGYVLDRFLGRMLNQLPLMDIALQESYLPPEEVTFDESELEGVEADWLGHLQLFSMFDEFASVDADHRSFRHAPALVAYHKRWGASPGASVVAVEEAVDVVANAQRVVSADQAGTTSPRGALRAGVWDTRVEPLALNPGTENHDTFGVFEAADREGIPIRVVRDVEDLEQVDMAPEARVHLARDLERGYVAVVPARPPSELPTAWWRVQPDTGETLGILGSGYGGAVEWLLLAGIAIGVAVGYATFLACGGMEAAQSSAVDKAVTCGVCGLLALAAAMVGFWLLPGFAGAMAGAGVAAGAYGSYLAGILAAVCGIAAWQM